MNVESLGLILCGVIALGVILLAVAAGLFLVIRKSSKPNPSELAYLREEVARLHKEVEQLREAVEQMNNGPRASGSTDIK